MSKIIKTVNWVSPKGSEIKVEIEATKSIEKEVSYSDGWNIDLGNKIHESKTISVYVNGRCEATTYSNPSIVEGILFTPKYIAKVKACGGYAVLADNVIINEEKYNIIMDAIVTVTNELELAFKNETIKLEVPQTDKEIASENSAKTEIERATSIIAEFKERKTEILSETAENQWKINYNNVNNEGGEGYIPLRVTLEDVEWAKKIINK